MARNENDREDILREATAMVERIAWQVGNPPQEVVAGFRVDGCLSLYFDQDPVYQFNTAGQLRRLYLSGCRYKAEQGRLIRLYTQRTPSQTMLVRHELTAEETAQVLFDMTNHLHLLQASLVQQTAQLVGQVPADAPVSSRVLDWLNTYSATLSIASSPHAK